MTSLSGLRVLVAGAGVVGACVALDLLRHGARVTLADGGAGAPNASVVAAGMLAPAMEALLDPVSGDHFHLLKTARDLWPEFADGLQLPVHRCGALLFADNSEALTAPHDRLLRLGARVERIDAAEAARLSPGLQPPGHGLFTPDDWRLDAPVARDALISAARDLGLEVTPAALMGLVEGGAVLRDGDRLDVDAVVLATGLPPVGADLDLPELQTLRPVKGQLVRFNRAGPRDGPIVRASGGYLVPSDTGVVVGATMEPGRADLSTNSETSERFAALGRSLYPELGAYDASPAVGVRSETPDGLPLAGLSSRPGVFLALGARRNGWLLAPLLAQVLRTALEGGAEDPLFSPARVLSPA